MRWNFTLKLLEVFKSSKICLKMISTMTPKTTDQNICFRIEQIRFNVQFRFNEGSFKIQVLINKHIRKILVSLRIWFAKYKMCEDDFSQKIGSKVILHGTVMQ